MATRSKMLCDRLAGLSSAARQDEAYMAALTYSTAEDLSDGMLKGDEGPARVEALLMAYYANAARGDAEEREAWERALEEARVVFDLPPGFLPDEAY